MITLPCRILRPFGAALFIGDEYNPPPVFPPVLTKRDFVERYGNGEFGNASPTWQTFGAWLRETTDRDPKELYHLRNRVQAGETYYNLGWEACLFRWTSVPDAAQWYCSAMAPTSLTLLQGEVMQTDRGLYLYFSRVRKPMRDALREKPEEAIGIRAVTLLRHFLNAKSYDWLEVLLDRYPGHVVEFSAYGKCWGTLPGYNTVFWEVRNY